MAKQLVLKNNRVIAYGEDCFLCIGSNVRRTTDSTVYEDATIAYCDSFPNDVDVVGYEYHAGEFVPCAPYGVGDGTIALWGKDCKIPLDSGLSMADFRKIYHTTYMPTNSSTLTITCGFLPRMAVFVGRRYFSNETRAYVCIVDVEAHIGLTFQNNNTQVFLGTVTPTATDTALKISGDNATVAMNERQNGYTYNYTVTIFG